MLMYTHVDQTQKRMENTDFYQDSSPGLATSNPVTMN